MHPAVPWAVFAVLVVVMLALDLGVFHRHAHTVRFREALAWSLVWIGVAMLFNLGIYATRGSGPALEFLAGYLLEKALSVDNLFVFVVIFNYFSVPPALQHRVLYWGIIGAVILRGIFVVVGAALLHRFSFMTYVFGGFLILTGIRLGIGSEEVHPERNPLLRLVRRFMPVTRDYHGTQLTIREQGRRLATPLLLVIVTVEATDVVFAVDSIPAIFAITTDTFIVYTSNIFAILGLRALYFLLAGAIVRFHHLKLGLALILVFVGSKMALGGVYHVPIVVSLGVIALLLALSVVASLVTRAPTRPAV